jgi:hypothetical protein
VSIQVNAGQHLTTGALRRAGIPVIRDQTRLVDLTSSLQSCRREGWVARDRRCAKPAPPALIVLTWRILSNACVGETATGFASPTRSE